MLPGHPLRRALRWRSSPKGPNAGRGPVLVVAAAALLVALLCDLGELTLSLTWIVAVLAAGLAGRSLVGDAPRAQRLLSSFISARIADVAFAQHALRRLAAATALLLTTIALGVALLAVSWQSSNPGWLSGVRAEILLPVSVTLAFLYFGWRLESVRPVVVSELDEVVRMRLEASGQRGEDLEIGGVRVHQLHLLAGPVRDRGVTRRIALERATVPRDIDRSLIRKLQAELEPELVERHDARLRVAAAVLGVQDVDDFVQRHQLHDEDTVDLLSLTPSERGFNGTWAQAPHSAFLYGTNRLDHRHPDHDATVREVATQGGHAATSYNHLGRSRLPCRTGTVTVVVSTVDKCIVGMERLAVTHATSDDYDEPHLALHFVGEGPIPLDFSEEVAVDGDPFMATSRRALSEELAITGDDVLSLNLAGVFFDAKRWQVVFTYVAFTELSVTEIVSRVKGAPDAYETRQLLPLGWDIGDTRLTGTVLHDAHPTIKLASNHATGALLLALAYRDGFWSLDASLASAGEAAANRRRT